MQFLVNTPFPDVLDWVQNGLVDQKRRLLRNAGIGGQGEQVQQALLPGAKVLLGGLRDKWGVTRAELKRVEEEVAKSFRPAATVADRIKKALGRDHATALQHAVEARQKLAADNAVFGWPPPMPKSSLGRPESWGQRTGRTGAGEASTHAWFRLVCPSPDAPFPVGGLGEAPDPCPASAVSASNGSSLRGHYTTGGRPSKRGTKLTK